MLWSLKSYKSHTCLQALAWLGIAASIPEMSFEHVDMTPLHGMRCCQEAILGNAGLLSCFSERAISSSV